jgi:hypothetical protein
MSIIYDKKSFIKMVLGGFICTKTGAVKSIKMLFRSQARKRFSAFPNVIGGVKTAFAQVTRGQAYKTFYGRNLLLFVIN